jgi:hypothetical protein
MADFYINVFLDNDRLAKVTDAGLSDKVVEIDGKKALKVALNAKEQKKLVKGFPELSFDADNASVLPAEADDKLFGIIMDTKTLDVMKVAIMKLYNPLAGKALRAAMR